MTSNLLQFSSSWEEGSLLYSRSEEELEAEPMLFAYSAAQALTHPDAPITREFLQNVLARWSSTDPSTIIVDSRTHMLMPGWFPCIPGWHLDDVPRTRVDGQPNHENPNYKAEHVCALIGDASITTGLRGVVSLQDQPLYSGPIYGAWHNSIEQMLASGKPELVESAFPVGRLVWFDWQTFHKGNPATKSGWRWFIRATRYSERPILNKVRKQTQVYLSSPMKGW